MPTGWTEREKAFEAKFAHDAEFRFLVLARRDRLFGQWAAGRLHMKTEAGAALVRDVLAISDRPGHDDALLRRVADAFAAHGVEPKTGELASALAECENTARRQMIDKPLDAGQE
jgi:hypothetical protein